MFTRPGGACVSRNWRIVCGSPPAIVHSECAPTQFEFGSTKNVPTSCGGSGAVVGCAPGGSTAEETMRRASVSAACCGVGGGGFGCVVDVVVLDATDLEVDAVEPRAVG